jgi:hypothetical protein
MASRRERREWRADFRDRGVANVRRMVQASNFSEEKLRYARCWLWRREHALDLTGAGIAGVVVIVGIALIVAILGLRPR